MQQPTCAGNICRYKLSQSTTPLPGCMTAMLTEKIAGGEVDQQIVLVIHTSPAAPLSQSGLQRSLSPHPALQTFSTLEHHSDHIKLKFKSLPYNLLYTSVVVCAVLVDVGGCCLS